MKSNWQPKNMTGKTEKTELHGKMTFLLLNIK